MNITEAAAAGVERLRRPQWPTGYMRVYVHDGLSGPWVTFWAREIQEAANLDCPQVLLSILADADFVPYDGEPDPADVKGWPKIQYAKPESRL